MRVYVIPCKNGLWRHVQMSEARHARWEAAWKKWWREKGMRLDISPEMWQSGSDIAVECSLKMEFGGTVVDPFGDASTHRDEGESE